VLFSAFTLTWQVFVLFACCSGIGLAWRFLLPTGFSILNKALFSLLGGLFLVVLIPQNLVYLGVPVRISAWLLLSGALVQAWLCRHKLLTWRRTFLSDTEIRTLAAVILLAVTFHGLVPIRQGLEWYYGKGYPDQFSYVVLAEFLKEEPYSTNEQDIGLHPWLIKPIGLKTQRIGQSIVAAEISVWSGTDGKGSYAATVIFFLAILTICLYVFLRETGIDCFMAGSGALLASLLPAVSRLSLDGFLSQLSILFVFPFFASLLLHQDLSPRGFTLFFSLAVAYLVAAYSEIAPIGLCTFFLGVTFVRHDSFRFKRLMFMSGILLVALVNPYYLPNLIGFLELQYCLAANAAFLYDMAPQVLTLRGWSELIFGPITSTPFASFFDCCAILLGLLFLAGAISLTRREKLIFGAILLPSILVILYLITRTSSSYYPIAKITLTILPCMVGLVFLALSRIARNSQARSIGAAKTLLSAFIVAAAAAGSVRYYSEVLNNGGLLRDVREARFQGVCSALEKIKNKRVLIFEAHPLLTPWLCYHARHNDAYFSGRFISDSVVPEFAPFARTPDLGNFDFVVTRDRIVDLRASIFSGLALVHNPPAINRAEAHVRYRLERPAGLHLLVLRPMSANLNMRFSPGSKTTTSSIDYFLADDHNHVYQGELWGKNVEIRQMNFPTRLSGPRLLINAKEGDRNREPSFSALAELDEL
jgi:hypothetical protein